MSFCCPDVSILKGRGDIYSIENHIWTWKSPPETICPMDSVLKNNITSNYLMMNSQYKGMNGVKGGIFLKNNQYNGFLTIVKQVIYCFYSQQVREVFPYFHPEIMWMGASENEYKSGYEAVTEYLIGTPPSKCRILNKNLTILYAGKGNCLVVGHYMAHTAENCGEILKEERRITFFGIKVLDQWKILHIHISDNGSIKDRPERNTPIILQDKKQVTHILRADNILYIEAVGGHAEIHEKSKLICMTQTLAEIKKKLPSQFFQVHRSYLINVLYVTELHRYEVKIDGRYAVPLSQKKYRQIRESILTRLEDCSLL